MLKNTFFSAVAAGMMVGIGGAVYMSCDNKYVGAVLFSVALLTICYMGMYLFTGKIGFLAESFSWDSVKHLTVGLLGNFVGATVFGYLVRFARPSITEKAATACAGKLESNFLAWIALGAMCGILMYVAVKIYREKNSVWGIFFCIPVFILCGFEHSIANMFYFALANMLTLKYFAFVLCVVLGNTVGAMILPWLSRLGTVKTVEKAKSF